MKRTLTLMTGALMLGVALNASATLITITLDENGTSAQNDGYTITHQQAVDSATGVSTLDYLIGAAHTWTQGWLAIYDDTAHTQLSDLIHFDGIVSGKQQLFFYSKDSGTDLADNWLTPAQIATIMAGNPPSVTENANFIASYDPASGQPGNFVVGTGNSLEWQFNSVPEPTTMIAGALLLLPFGASTLRMLRRRTA
jgi:hypothetical protein